MNQTQTPVDHYQNFYRSGGWSYNLWRESLFLLRRVIWPTKLSRGSRVLDLGCGAGVQTAALAKVGMSAVGVDASSEGIKRATDRFPGVDYHCMDAAGCVSEFGTESFDMIYCRGMSWYHYELNGINKNEVDVPARTAEFMTLLKPGGVFLLQIATDYSGSAPTDAVHFNTLQAYFDLFGPLGDVFRVTSWKGKPVLSQAQALNAGNGIMIFTRRR